MMTIGEDELICDLAETYGVFDMRSLPASTVAVLADGLRPDSRIKSKIAGKEEVSVDTILRARTVDLLSLLVWMRTKDGMRGKNQPASVTEMLLKREKPEQKELKGFRTAEEFQEAWKAGGGG